MRLFLLAFLGLVAILIVSTTAPAGEFHPPPDAKRVTYEDLARFPNKYRGTTGFGAWPRQAEYESNDNYAGVVVDISGKQFALGQTAAVRFRWGFRWEDSEPRFIEDDAVDAWGTFVELKTFHNAFNMEVIVAIIDAREIRMAPETKSDH
jgi:hypothetical protein